jgi:uncharacterized membrane protein
MVLFLAFALLAVGISLVSSDDAEAAQYDLRLRYTGENNVQMSKGRNPITFNYTITHTGDVLSQEVYVKMIDLDPAWANIVYSASTQHDVYTDTYNGAGDVDMDILMQKGETASLIVTVTPPFNQLNKTYWFTMNVWPRKDAGQNESHTFGIIIPQIASFEIALWNPPPGGEFKAIPPSTVTIRFAMWNTGNGVDEFLVRGESSRSDAGWTLEFVSGVNEWGFSPNLTPDPNKRNPHFIDVRIPIPAGERAGVTAQVTINATSLFNASKQMPPAFASITSLQYYNFQVYINGPDNKEGIPGNEVEFQLKINNSGNGWDTFSIKPIWDLELNPEFIASANPRNLDIDTMTTETIQYIVKVPESAPKKTYFFTAEVKSSSPELAPVTKSFAVEVGQYYAIEMFSSEPARRQTIPGGNLEFEVTVHNTGNGLDSIVINDILGAPSGWLTYTQPPEVTLLQDQEAMVKIIVIVPSHFEEAPIGFYNLTVPATSSRSDASTEFYLEIEITQFFRIEWLYQGEDITNPDRPVAQQGSVRPRRSFNPYEKNTIDVTLEMKNYGNGGDNISMDGYSPDARIKVAVTPAYTFLLRDQVKFIKVSIEVPEDLPPGVYHLFVNGSSEDTEFITRQVPLDFEVENYDAAVPLIPTYIDPKTGDVVRAEINVDETSNLSFKLKVENNGTRPLSSVTVRVFDNYVDDKGQQVRWNFFNYTTPPIAVGDRFIVGERPFTPTNPPLFWWANETGVHIIEFKVFFNDQAEKDNDVSTINVTVQAETSENIDPLDTAMTSIIIAIAVAVIIVVGYVYALRRKPQVDADLYSSIYGADFEDDAMGGDVSAPAAEEDAGLSPEQEALYGEDYGEETAEGEYDYDYDYGEEYAEGEYEYEDGEYEYAEGEYAEGEYAEGEYAEGETTEVAATEGEAVEVAATEGEAVEGEAVEGEYDEEYYEGEYDEDTDADYEEDYTEEVTKE